MAKVERTSQAILVSELLKFTTNLLGVHELPVEQLQRQQQSLRRIQSGLEISQEIRSGRFSLAQLGLTDYSFSGFSSIAEGIRDSVEVLNEKNVTGDALAALLINQWGYRVSYTREILRREGFTAEHVPYKPASLEVCSWPHEAEDALKSWIETFRICDAPAQLLGRFGTDAASATREKKLVEARGYEFPEGFTPMHKQGAQASTSIRRRELTIRNFWTSTRGEKFLPTDDYALPTTPDTFKEFVQGLLYAHIEGDAIAELFKFLGISTSGIIKSLETLGFDVKALPLAPGDYPSFEVSRFPERIGQESNPENFPLIYMEECSPLITAEVVKASHPWQARLYGIN